MKNSKFKYKYLTTIVFVVLLAAGMYFNLKETLSNRVWAQDGGGIKAIRSVFLDLESVDSIKYPFINLNGLYQSLLQRNYMYEVDSENNLIRAEGGYLSGNTSSKANEKKLEKTADEFARTEAYLKSQDIPLVYVQSATKGAISEKPLIAGIENNSFGKVESFLGKLRDRGIEVVDTRDYLEGEGFKAFFKTDHHWTIDSAFKVYENLCEYLNEEHKLGIDRKTYDESNWNREVYEEAFLGAEGRRTGIYYVGLDEFSVYTPKESAEYELEGVNRYGETFERKGSYEETIMDLSKDPSRYSFEDSAYYIYWGGDYGHVHVNNRSMKKGPKIMIIKDSFGVPVSAFMANSFKSMDVIDARYYSGSVKALVQKNKPDIVVYVYGSGYFEKSKSFRMK